MASGAAYGIADEAAVDADAEAVQSGPEDADGVVGAGGTGGSVQWHGMETVFVKLAGMVAPHRSSSGISMNPCSQI